MEKIVGVTKEILDSIGENILLVDRDYKIIFANSMMLQLFKQKDKDVIGKKCHDLFHRSPMPCHEDNKCDIKCPHSEVFKTGKTISLTHVHIMPDGIERVLEITASPVRDEKGNVIHMIEILKDVTEKKKTEDITKSMLDNVVMGVSMISPKMEIIWLNKTFKKWFPNIDVRKKPLCYQSFYSPPKKEICDYCPTIKAFKTGEIHSSETGVCADGKIYNVIATPVKNERGEIDYVVETVEDITDRKLMEKEVYRYGERLRILHEIDQAIFTAQTQEAIAKAALEKIRKLVSCRQASVSLFDFSAGQVTILAEYLDGVTMVGMNKRLSLEEFGINENLQKGEVNVVSDLMAISKPSPEEQSLIYKGIYSIINVPLIAYGELIGTLNLGSDKTNSFSSRDIDVSREMADSLAVAIKSKQTEEAMQESEKRYRNLFEDSPISLWEEDFSEVKSYISDLRDSGVKDFRAYFKNNPEDVVNCVRKVKVVDVNKATLELYKAKSKDELLADLSKVFTEESYDVFREELIAIAEGKTSFEGEAVNRTLTGDKKHIFLKWSLAPGYKEILSKLIVSIFDITERKQVEQALQQSGEEHRLLIQNVDEIIYAVDIRTDPFKGQLNFVSAQVENIIGFRTDEFLRDPQLWIQLVHPDDIPSLVEDTNKAIKDKKKVARYYRLRHKSTGEYRWLEDRIVPQIDGSGNVVSFFGVARDITERKKAEEAIRESEKKYRYLVDNSPVGVYKTNLGGALLYVNKALANMLEFESPEEMMKGGVLVRYKNRHDREVLIGNLKKTRRVNDFEVEVLTKTARTKVVFLSAALEGDTISGMIMDVTEQRRAENAVRESEVFLSSILEGIQDGVVVLDRDFRILFANSSYIKQTGASSSEIKGKHCYESSYNRDKPCYLAGLECSVKKVFETGLGSREVRKKFDKYMEMTVYPLKDFSGNVVSVVEIRRDVTKNIQLDEELKKRMRELEEFYDMAVGRELKMKELKKEVERLKKELRKYKVRKEHH